MVLWDFETPIADTVEYQLITDSWSDYWSNTPGSLVAASHVECDSISEGVWMNSHFSVIAMATRLAPSGYDKACQYIPGP